MWEWIWAIDSIASWPEYTLLPSSITLFHCDFTRLTDWTRRSRLQSIELCVNRLPINQGKPYSWLILWLGVGFIKLTFINLILHSKSINSNVIVSRSIKWKLGARAFRSNNLSFNLSFWLQNPQTSTTGQFLTIYHEPTVSCHRFGGCHRGCSCRTGWKVSF